MSYERISDTAKFVRKVAITRTEAQTINKYRSYNDNNGVYSPQNIKSLLEASLVEINDTLEAIKETK